MSNDKLANLLRDCLSDYSHPNFTDRRGMADRIRAALQAHAAEAAQAQAQSGEWVQKAIVDAKGDIEYVHVRIFNAMKARAEEAEAMLAAAPQQAAEPVAYTWSKTPDKDGVFRKIALYTHPQPAKDASKYQELLMAVEKKFPGESRHDTALRYIRQAELRSCEPKCDAAMAKESGR